MGLNGYLIIQPFKSFWFHLLQRRAKDFLHRYNAGGGLPPGYPVRPLGLVVIFIEITYACK
jgi:hypothetical protein